MAIGDVIREQLKLLLEVRNSFAQYRDIVDVCNHALRLAQAHVPSQVVAMFLVDKDGGLSRVAINGWDRDGRPFEDSWFPTERYTIGRSFTGGAAEPPPGDTHGVPTWSNKLDMLTTELQHRNVYMERLDRLNSGVAIPLNGRFRTFGVLRVLNRLRPNPQEITEFDEEDIFWLAHIGNSAASAISAIRRQNDFGILAAIGRKLVVPFDPRANVAATYADIASELVGPLTSYRASVIRVVSDRGDIQVVGKAADGVSWAGWEGENVRPGGVVREVLQSGRPVTLEDISTHPRRFRNYEWMQTNGLHGYLCFPLIAPGAYIGTLSLFTSFPYRVTPVEIQFLENVASLIAAFVESTKLVDLQDARVERAEEGVSTFASQAAKVTLKAGQRRIRDVKHEYKNHFYNIMRDLEEAAQTGTRRPKLIKRALEYARARHEEISDELADSYATTRPLGVDLNELVTEAASFIDTGSRRRSISVDTRLGKHIPVLAIDPDDLRHAIKNVLDNAVKALQHSRERDGRVTIRTELIRQGAREFIQISVEDNGIGIRKEFAERIYEEGFSTYEKGTGVGLYNAREIMRQYGGSISHVSTNAGSTFFLCIPTRPFEMRQDAC